MSTPKTIGDLRRADRMCTPTASTAAASGISICTA